MSDNSSEKNRHASRASSSNREKSREPVMVNLTMNTRATDAHTTRSPTEGLSFFAPSRLCVFVFQFNAKAQRRRDAKGVVNLCLHVLRVVVHQTDHYINVTHVRSIYEMPATRITREPRLRMLLLHFAYAWMMHRSAGLFGWVLSTPYPDPPQKVLDTNLRAKPGSSRVVSLILIRLCSCLAIPC
jgi:hypothetical protein